MEGYILLTTATTGTLRVVALVLFIAFNPFMSIEAKFGESSCYKQEQGLVRFHKKYFHALDYDYVFYVGGGICQC